MARNVLASSGSARRGGSSRLDVMPGASARPARPATNGSAATSCLPDGEIQVSATNGAIELEGYDGATVEVRAERIARAASDDAARELVSRIEIKEEVLPNRVSIRTEGISGILIGVSYQVKYQVRAPHSVVARLRVTNGVVTAKAFAGQLIATSTNGGIVGEGSSGKVEARSTNGNVQIALQAIAPGGVSLRTTNGRVDLSLPPAAKADLSAECRNGAVTVEGLGDRGVRRAVPPRRQRPPERRRPAG